MRNREEVIKECIKNPALNLTLYTLSCGEVSCECCSREQCVHVSDTERERCCCNCRHNIRTGEPNSIQCHCDIDNRYIGYLDVFTKWCRHWASDRK